MSADAQLAEATARKICQAESLTFVGAVGAGAFKFTFHVKRKSGENIALKLFKASISERTAREIDAMQRCKHPDIGRFFSLHQFDDQGVKYFYSIEEFLAGGSLADRLKNGLLPADAFYEIGGQLIDAVGHIAGLGLVHRDLKPDNIMFRDGTNKAVIVDFGLVRDLQAESITDTWAMRGPGTPVFASPEQLNNEKSRIDWRSDQFGLGVTLAIARFGYFPNAQPGDSAINVVQRVSARENVSNKFMTECTQTNTLSLVKMIAPWPIHRYRTPQQLADAWDKERP